MGTERVSRPGIRWERELLLNGLYEDEEAADALALDDTDAVLPLMNRADRRALAREERQKGRRRR